MINVSSVLVYLTQDGIAKSHLLFGMRRDSNKYSMPGGHLEEGEDPKAGAIREMAEECGFECPEHQMEYVGSKLVLCKDSKERMIHAFKVELSAEDSAFNFHSKNDPDQEVSFWHKIPLKNNKLPVAVASNLHASPNVCLDFAGISYPPSPTAKELKLPDIVDGELRLVSDSSKTFTLPSGVQAHSYKVMHKTLGPSGNVMIKSAPVLFSNMGTGMGALAVDQAQQPPVKTKQPPSQHILQKMELSPALDKSLVVRALLKKYKSLHNTKGAFAFSLKKSVPKHMVSNFSIKLHLKNGGGCLKCVHSSNDVQCTNSRWTLYSPQLEPVAHFDVWSDDSSVSVMCSKTMGIPFSHKCVMDCLKKYFLMPDDEYSKLTIAKLEKVEKSMQYFPAKESVKRLQYLKMLKRILQKDKDSVEMMTPHGKLYHFSKKWFHLLVGQHGNAYKTAVSKDEAANYATEREFLINALAGTDFAEQPLPPPIDQLAYIRSDS